MNTALDVTAALLARLASTVRSRGGTLVVVFLPYDMDFVADRRYDGLANRLVDRLESVGRNESFPVFDLRSQLGAGRGLYLDRMHFNPEGHRRVAEALNGLMVGNGLLPATHVE
jgi:hypothetical protein